MDEFDKDRLLSIFETSAAVALGKQKEDELSILLQDFDLHLRARYVQNLINIFRNGMSLKQDLETFGNIANETFKGQTVLPKALTNYWKFTGESLKQEYWQRNPFDSHLVNLKWVALVPSDSKFGLSNSQAKVRCMFETTDEDFSMDFSPAALNHLAKELQEIHSVMPKSQ